MWTCLTILHDFFSLQAHSSVERAGLLGAVHVRKIESDECCRMRGPALENAIKEDINKGFIPFYVNYLHLYYKE